MIIPTPILVHILASLIVIPTLTYFFLGMAVYDEGDFGTFEKMNYDKYMRYKIYLLSDNTFQMEIYNKFWPIFCFKQEIRRDSYESCEKYFNSYHRYLDPIYQKKEVFSKQDADFLKSDPWK